MNDEWLCNRMQAWVLMQFLTYLPFVLQVNGSVDFSSLTSKPQRKKDSNLLQLFKMQINQTNIATLQKTLANIIICLKSFLLK